MRKCEIDGCGRKHAAKGLCSMHYYRKRNNNGVMPVRTTRDRNEIESIDGRCVFMHLYNINKELVAKTKIDADDVTRCLKHKWYLGKRGYVTSRINRKLIYLHNFITGNHETDHKNRDPLDNRKENLRPCSQRQNTYNSRGCSNKTSKYKGVHLNRNGKWVSQCSGKHIGTFETEPKAAKAYNEYAKQIYGEFAYLNKINGGSGAYNKAKE
jgi:hypothetical protein